MCYTMAYLFYRDLETDKTNVTALLTKFARASMLKGVKVYNSRKPISWHTLDYWKFTVTCIAAVLCIDAVIKIWKSKQISNFIVVKTK